MVWWFCLASDKAWASLTNLSLVWQGSPCPIQLSQNWTVVDSYYYLNGKHPTCIVGGGGFIAYHHQGSFLLMKETNFIRNIILIYLYYYISLFIYLAIIFHISMRLVPTLCARFIYVMQAGLVFKEYMYVVHLNHDIEAFK